MLKIKEEIQSMYNYLTGNSYDEFELNQMSNRELRGLHSELFVSFREDQEFNSSIYYDIE
jgi:hypothetical protein